MIHFDPWLAGVVARSREADCQRRAEHARLLREADPDGGGLAWARRAAGARLIRLGARVAGEPGDVLGESPPVLSSASR